MKLERKHRLADEGSGFLSSFLMVLTGTDLEYTREDGVVVCPLGCLRP